MGSHCFATVDISPFVIVWYSNIILLVHLHLWTSNFLEMLLRNASDTYFSPKELFLTTRYEKIQQNDTRKTVDLFCFQFRLEKAFLKNRFWWVLQGCNCIFHEYCPQFSTSDEWWFLDFLFRKIRNMRDNDTKMCWARKSAVSIESSKICMYLMDWVTSLLTVAIQKPDTQNSQFSEPINNMGLLFP